MDGLTKTIQNNILAAFGTKAPDNVLKAIHKASTNAGVNFAYMVQQAGVESSFNPAAKAKSSSATGLYQFISSTWMDMMDKYAGKYGIDTADMSKKEILALRKDPEVAANMAAEFAKENEQFLENNWGGEVGSTELYLAHFMGAGGATAFLKAKDKNALQPAADLMPQAARSNRNVFFDRQGRAKTIDEVYAFFDKKFKLKESDLPALDNPMPEELMAEAALEDKATPQNAAVISSVYTPSTHQPTTDYSRFNERTIPSSQTNHGSIPGAYQNLLRSPVDLMMLTQVETPGLGDEKTSWSLF